MGSEIDWKGLRRDAEEIKNHMQRWLTRQGIPDPVVYIKETSKEYPKPAKFTFVGSTGINHETVELPSELIDSSQDDLALLAHGASEIMLGKLLKSTGKIS